MNKLEKTLNFEHLSIQALYLMVAAAVSGFTSPFFLAKGYTNTQIGTILSVSSLLAIFFQTIFADIVDRNKRFNVVEMMLIPSFLAMLVYIPLFFIQKASFLFTFLYVCGSVLFSCTGPLLTSVGFKMEEAGVKTNYGFARAFGSLSWAITCAIVGVIVDKYTGNIIPIVAIVCFLCFEIVCLLTNKTFHQNKIGEITTKEKKVQEESVTYLEFIQHNKSLILMCLCIPIMMFTSNIIGHFLVQIIEPLGGTVADSGFLSSMAAILELPCMMLFSRINKKMKLEKILTIAAIAYALKAIGLHLSTSMWMVYVSLSLQWCSFALYTPGIVEYINRHTSKKETVRGQALYSVITSIGTMITSFVSGIVLDNYGTNTLTLISAIACSTGAILLIVMLRKNDKQGDSAK